MPATAGLVATAWLSASTLSVSVSAPPWARIPPPVGPRPPLTVSPEMVTSAEVILKTRLIPPASTSSRWAPGPWMVTFRLTASSPLVK